MAVARIRDSFFFGVGLWLPLKPVGREDRRYDAPDPTLAGGFGTYLRPIAAGSGRRSKMDVRVERLTSSFGSGATLRIG